MHDHTHNGSFRFNAPKGGNAVLTHAVEEGKVSLSLEDCFNAPKGGNAVLTYGFVREYDVIFGFNAPKGGNAVLTQGFGQGFGLGFGFQCPEGR